MKITSLTLLLCLSSLVFAQDKPKTTPQVTDAQKVAFWKAQAAFIAAQNQLEQSKQRLQGTIQEMSKACGDDFILVSDQAGDPACSPKPKEKK